ncbi:MAG: hypothetical protein RI958_91 [Actinomycetota bacterium]|jgi:Flp pilus assembly protein TadG
MIAAGAPTEAIASAGDRVVRRAFEQRPGQRPGHGNRYGRRHDRGSFVVVVAVVVVLAGLMSVGAARAGTAMLHRQQAQTAADAAALAGVEGGRVQADRLAAANGGQLVSFERSGGWDGFTVTVEVTRGGVSARARASSQP